MDRYRAYIVPGEPAPGAERAVIDQAAARALQVLGDDEDVVMTLETVVALVCGDEVGSAGRTASAARSEVVVRFAQTCGPVHAKGLEDTAFYRYTRFLAVTEVGSDPERIGVEPDDLHDHALEKRHTHPDAMTTLSTHDTKRSEDVRARLAVLTEQPLEWAVLVQDLDRATSASRGDRVDGAVELLLWQVLVSCWDLPGADAPRITADRLEGYLLKAMREAKTLTTWTDQDSEYEQQVLDLGRAALASEEVDRLLTEWTRRTHAAQRTAILGQKLVQLTMPGVPDVYQGNETIDLSLVDPDNRRAVDHAAHAERLTRMLEGAGPDGIGDEKLWLTRSALVLRRQRPELFQGRDAGYQAAAHHHGPRGRLRPRRGRGRDRGGDRRHPTGPRPRPAGWLGRRTARPPRGPLARSPQRRRGRRRDGAPPVAAHHLAGRTAGAGRGPGSRRRRGP